MSSCAPHAMSTLVGSINSKVAFSPGLLRRRPDGSGTGRRLPKPRRPLGPACGLGRQQVATLSRGAVECQFAAKEPVT